MLFLSCVCYAFVRVCLLMPCGHLGKGLTSWLSVVMSIVSFLFSHWYPVSGVVLDLSIPDLCPLSYLEQCHHFNSGEQFRVIWALCLTLF